jgi:tetratricopeptide (TPR) repeat protein
MNKTEFIQLIQNHDLPSAKHVAALKQVVADFPYFSQARVLLAKALHNEKHYEYEKFLKQTALVVPDRDVLYHYLHNLTPHWQIPQLSISIEQPNVIEQNEIVSDPGHAFEQVEEEVSLTIHSLPETLISDEEIEVVQNKEELDVDLAITILLEGSNIAPPQKNIFLPPTSIEKVIDKDIESQNVALPDVKSQVPDKFTEDSVEEKLSFVEWLNRKTNPEKIAEPIQPLQTDKSISDEKADTKDKELRTNALPEVTKAEIEEAVAKSNVNDFQSILDKFVKENPSISRPKAEFFNPVNMARQSVEEDEELVTETLANLFYKQGNYKKAIKAYEKLCLLYPSKMTYFASLIQKIKTELKD